MLVVGLTGGIGAGKTTFARLLEQRGAKVVDADALGHATLAPGEPAWHSVVDQFGDEVLVPGSMEIDRKHLGRIVFSEPRKLAALNAITHPVILRRIADILDTFHGTDAIVVLDAALLVELGVADALDVIVVITARAEMRRDRVIRTRDITAEEVDRRIASQARPEDLLAKADVVVVNEGDIEALGQEADRVWNELQERNQ